MLALRMWTWAENLYKKKQYSQTVEMVLICLSPTHRYYFSDNTHFPGVNKLCLTSRGLLCATDALQKTQTVVTCQNTANYSMHIHSPDQNCHVCGDVCIPAISTYQLQHTAEYSVQCISSALKFCISTSATQHNATRYDSTASCFVACANTAYTSEDPGHHDCRQIIRVDVH